jgi:hypothetical protein
MEMFMAIIFVATTTADDNELLERPITQHPI